MTDPLPIQYRDFYDFPRMFVVRCGSTLILFDGSYRDDLDDYPNQYEVFVLPPLADADLVGSWEPLPGKAIRHVGQVPTSQIEFDKTRRKSVDGGVLRTLLHGAHSV